MNEEEFKQYLFDSWENNPCRKEIYESTVWDQSSILMNDDSEVDG